MNMVAVHGANVGRFLRNVESIGSFHLHAEGEFERFDARFQPRVSRALPEMLAVDLAQEIELAALHAGGGVRAADVLDQFLHFALLRVHESSLKNSWQKTCLPVFG